MFTQYVVMASNIHQYKYRFDRGRNISYISTIVKKSYNKFWTCDWVC